MLGQTARSTVEVPGQWWYERRLPSDGDLVQKRVSSAELDITIRRLEQCKSEKGYNVMELTTANEATALAKPYPMLKPSCTPLMSSSTEATPL